MDTASILSPPSLSRFLSGNPVDEIRSERALARYDLISFGGGSCPKVIGRYAANQGWSSICFLTNGSDNGGSTQRIVEALAADYGPTLPVGDITSALIGLMDAYQYEVMNLRAWRLDPARFSEREIREFQSLLESERTFAARLDRVTRYYRKKLESDTGATIDERRRRFFSELLHAGRLVDEVGLIRSGVKGLDLSEAGVRHHVFNAVMMRTGAYDRARKSPNPDRFMVGLRLLEKALAIDYAVFPCSIERQVLHAEWVDNDRQVLWSTRHRSKEHPVLDAGGQVALSNAPDAVKRCEGGFARYGKFGFDPDLPTPAVYPEAEAAIRRLRPGYPIIFGPSSFIASIAPCLAVAAITEAVAARSDCPRILFLNLTLNNETIGWGIQDFLDFWELNTGRPVSETLDYVVANNDADSSDDIAAALKDKGDTLETFKFRGPVLAGDRDRSEIPERGVHLVEAPLATVTRELVRLSSLGERRFVYVPNHHSRRLMTLCRRIVDDFNSNKDSPHTKSPATMKLDANLGTDAILHRAVRRD